MEILGKYLSLVKVHKIVILMLLLIMLIGGLNGNFMEYMIFVISCIILINVKTPKALQSKKARIIRKIGEQVGLKTKSKELRL